MHQKARLFSILLLGCSACLPGVASAANGYYPTVYWGAGLGKINLSLDTDNQDLSTLALNLAFGYRFAPMFSAEIMGAFSIDDERDDIASEEFDARVSVESATYGAYLVLRPETPFFVTARAGIAGTRFTYTAPGFADATESGAGLAGAFGAGFQQDSWAVTAEYWLLPEVDDPLFDSTYDAEMMSVTFTLGF